MDGPIAAANSITLGGVWSTIDVRTGTLPRLDMLPGGLITRSNGGNVTITGPFTASGGGSALSSGALVTQGVTTITGVVNPLNNWTNSGTSN